jgi:hypothetical protein
MIVLKIRVGTDIVDASSHCPVIDAQLCNQVTFLRELIRLAFSENQSGQPSQRTVQVSLLRKPIRLVFSENLSG